MTEREALKLALEALENTTPTGFNMERDKQFFAAIAAIKEALAQPDGCQCPACKVTPHASDCAVHNEPAYPKGACDCGGQPEQEPVAITITGKLGNIYSFTGDYSLKKGDKVYTTQPQPEPVIDKSAAIRIATSLGWEPKRTWSGLTEEEQQELYDAWMQKDDGWGSFYTLIEAKLRSKNT